MRVASKPVIHSLKSCSGSRSKRQKLFWSVLGSSLVELESLVAFGKAEAVEQQRNTDLVQHLHEYVHRRPGVIDEKGKKFR
jgi:hypothetical protein